MTMLYNVEKGPCTQSYGVYVAMAAGFPPEVIAAAKRKASELESEHSFWSTESGKQKHRNIVATMDKFLSLPIPELSTASDLEKALNTLNFKY